METQKAALSLTDAAAYLGLNPSYLYKLVSQKKIPYYKPMGGRVFFRREELEGFIFRNRQGAGYEAGHA